MEAAAAGRAPGAVWRRRVLAAPGLTLLGALLLLVCAVADDRHGHRASALCHQVPVPWTLFALSWASLVCGVAGSVVCAVFFAAARREGRRGSHCWPGTLAVCICVAGALPLIFEAAAVYGVHAEAGEAYWSCAGAGGGPRAGGLAAGTGGPAGTGGSAGTGPRAGAGLPAGGLAAIPGAR